MKLFKKMLVSGLLVVGVAGVAAPAMPVAAINVFPQCTTANSTSAVCQSSKKDSANDMIKTIISTMLQLLGSVSIIMIIVGGIRYTTADADASKLKNARDTIIYSVVGLVVAISSYAIVIFVIGKF